MKDKCFGIERASGEADYQYAAKMLVKYEPWKSLGRTFEYSLTKVRDKDSELYVAKSDEKMVGCILIQMNNTLKGFVRAICVDEEYRGQSIGTKMLSFIERRIFMEKSNVFLFVSASNKRAKMLYERLGYQQVGLFKDYIVKGEDEMLLRKTIGPSNDFIPTGIEEVDSDITKVFFCDIDGTLVKGKMPIKKNVIEAAKRFMHEDGVLCLCTGRAPISVRHIAKQINPNGLSVLYTGGAIYDFKNEEYLWYSTFREGIKVKLEQLVSDYPSISVQVYTKDNIYLLQVNDLLLSRGVKEELSQDFSTILDITDFEEIIKLVLTDEDPEILKDCRKRVFDEEGYKFEFSSTHFVEVVPDSAGKDNGAMRVIEYLGIKKPVIFAAGDGMTDIPIMQKADISFAPENAAEKVLQTVQFIVPTCEHGGMVDAFQIASKFKVNDIEK